MFYYLEDSESGPTKLSVNKTDETIYVYQDINKDKGWFTSVTYNDYSNVTVMWKHGAGEGTITIPSTVVFTLHDVFPILHHVSGNRIFSPVRIYATKPINVNDVEG